MSLILLQYLFSLLIRSLGVGFLVVLATARMRNPSKRHAAWTGVLLFMLLMPLVDAALPAKLVPAPLQRLSTLPATAFVEQRSDLEVPPMTTLRTGAPHRVAGSYWAPSAVAIYVSVALAFVFRLVWAYRSISRLKRLARNISADLHHLPRQFGGVVVLDSGAVRIPVTSGFIRPFVLLPQDWRSWDDWKLRAVLTHEFMHIRRRDYWTTVLAAINKCVFWFNPLAWWVERQLNAVAEKACDEATVCALGDSTRYAEVLLQFATAAQHGGRLRTGGLAMASRKMRTRIERVLTLSRPGTGVLGASAWMVVIAALVPTLYATSALRVRPAYTLPQFAPTSSAWLDTVGSIISPEERAAFERFQTDEERHHFIEQFWARRFPSWPDVVSHILKDEERAAYQRLQSSEERNKFIEQFWARMDPTPGTFENEFKEAFYWRLEYESLRLIPNSAPDWWKTDRGRIYVMYGQPQEVVQRPAGGKLGDESVSYPFEEWRYGRIEGLGAGVTFFFADPAQTGAYFLKTTTIQFRASSQDSIETVQIRGNRAISSETIHANLRTKQGDAFNPSLVDADTTALRALSYFDSVRADISVGPMGGKVVTFEFKEKPWTILASFRGAEPAQGYIRGTTVRLKNVTKPAEFKIVGVPGDQVRADETGVYVNDIPVTDFSSEFLTRFRSASKVVPQGHYFIMGEQRVNRDIAENMSLVPESSLEDLR